MISFTNKINIAKIFKIENYRVFWQIYPLLSRCQTVSPLDSYIGKVLVSLKSIQELSSEDYALYQDLHESAVRDALVRCNLLGVVLKHRRTCALSQADVNAPEGRN
eukprot:XP_001706910.1 Hypothetical protein GL50803_19973 [Giardia lamblia ATCC 50803]